MTDQNDMRDRIMRSIEEGRVHMRPRSYFALTSALAIAGVTAVLLTLVYVASLGIFLLERSGAWFAPVFGVRGWFVLLGSIPWAIVVSLVVFVIALELFSRHFSFSYRRPMLLTAAGIFFVILVGGYLLSLTPLHHQLRRAAIHGMVPPPLRGVYGPLPPRPDMVKGRVVAIGTSTYMIVVDGGSTSTVHVTRLTRRPLGEAIEIGDSIVVIGDASTTGTIEAFGLREIEDLDSDY